MRIEAFRDVPYSRASFRISSAGIPQIFSAHSGVQVAARSLRLREAKYVLVDIVVVNEVFRDQRLDHGHRKGAVSSRLGAMCQSACLAVRDLYGSITTTFAPFWRASMTKGQWCRLVLSVLQPQIMIYFE